MSTGLPRRQFLSSAGALLVVTVVPWVPGRSDAAAIDLDRMYQQRFGDRRPRDGGVTLEVSQMVENGNSVAVTVTATGADPAPVALHLLMPRNPDPWGMRFRVAAPALPEISTRVRLSGTQNLTAIAEWADGRLGAHAVTVLVTLGACIDENYAEWVRP